MQDYFTRLEDQLADAHAQGRHLADGWQRKSEPTAGRHWQLDRLLKVAGALAVVGVSTVIAVIALSTLRGQRANLRTERTRPVEGQLPQPLAADCGSGVIGIRFIAYGCSSGAAGTKYAHSAELLVLRLNGRYISYHDSISEPNLMVRSTTGEVVAAHNDSIVRVSATALETLLSKRHLDQLLPGSPGLAAINALTVTASGAVLFHANYYAPDQHGCANVRAELTTAGRVKVLGRSASGRTCG